MANKWRQVLRFCLTEPPVVLQRAASNFKAPQIEPHVYRRAVSTKTPEIDIQNCHQLFDFHLVNRTFAVFHLGKVILPDAGFSAFYSRISHTQYAMILGSGFPLDDNFNVAIKGNHQMQQFFQGKASESPV